MMTTDIIKALNYVTEQKNSGTKEPNLEAYATAISDISKLYLKKISKGDINMAQVASFGASLPQGAYFENKGHNAQKLSDVVNHYSVSVNMMFPVHSNDIEHTKVM